MAGSGFWSYVHADDEADGGRVSRLARDMVAQYEMLTAESIELFLDRDALEWGNRWKNKVDGSLASVVFFIPVITPRYFRSAECRRELQFFARQATNLGVRELVMPLLYVDFSALHAESPTDDLITMIREFQWEDWTDLRFADPTSPDYRRGLDRLAARLIAANEEAERTEGAAASQQHTTQGEADEEEPGFMDRMAEAEVAMPEWGQTLQDIGQEINDVAAIVNEANEAQRESDRRKKGFAGRLVVARQLARDLTEPASRIHALGNDFTTQLHAVDDGIRAIIEVASAHAADDSEERRQVCDFFSTVRGLSAEAHTGLSALKQMIDAIAPVERQSRDLRPVLREMRQGLTLMLEGREVTDEWVNLMDASPLACELDEEAA